jgi:hypothetical protein
MRYHIFSEQKDTWRRSSKSLAANFFISDALLDQLRIVEPNEEI